MGAGIYEELLFRLILLNRRPSACWRGSAPGRGASTVGGIVLMSLAFSTAHYLGPYGDTFQPVHVSVPLSGGRVLLGVVPVSRLRHRDRQRTPFTTCWWGLCR